MKMHAQLCTPTSNEVSYLLNYKYKYNVYPLEDKVVYSYSVIIEVID